MILNADLADGLAIADAVRITRAVNLGEAAYIHSDHLGTPQKMTDAGGSIVWDRVARPFGSTHSESGSLATDLRFPGQLHDAESGLHYNYFRDYDPTLGRYIQSDPIGLNGGINTYGYAYQNSVRYIDPTGENPIALGLALGRACASNPACRKALANTLTQAGQLLADGLVIGLGIGAMMSQDASESDNAEEEICEVDGENDDFCYQRWLREDSACWQWRGLGMNVVRACKTRAFDRLGLCSKNGGKPNPDEPPEYNPFVDYPR